MNYQEFQPAPLLSGYVECYWMLEGEALAAPERLLPDGCSELVFNFGDRFHEYDARGGCRVQPARLVVGQMTRPVLLRPAGRVEVLGVRFAPGGALPFLSVPSDELTDRILPLDEVARELERELGEGLEGAASRQTKIACLEAVLLRRLDSFSPRGVALQPALARFVRSGGALAVDRLADELGVSRRQLERRFVREVGLGPKLLGRILRFQQVFRAFEAEQADWPDIAVRCGYYDQAHLIRDFHRFAGQTPAVLFDGFSRLTELFTRRHRRSHFSNTPAPPKR